MKLFSQKIYVFLALVIPVLAGCEKAYDDITQLDDQNIQAYIKQTGGAFQEYNDTGIYYKVDQMGTGAPIDFTQQSPVVISARSLDGKFMATDTLAYYNRYANYFGYVGLYGTKQQEAIPQLIKAALQKKGGTIRILVPSRMAYGRNSYTSIPGYTNIEVPGNSCIEATIKVLDESKLEAYEDQTITKYLAANSLTGYTKSADGIYYKISAAGSDTTDINIEKSLTMDYTGKLLNGSTFDSSTGYISQLKYLVTSWQKIVPLLKKGGSVRFVTPSRYGYGLSGSSTIPAFSPLDFQVSVTAVQ